jgi:hypothetical protein
MTKSEGKRSLFIDFLIVIYFSLKPIYIFSSGGIQPADVIMIFLFFFLIYIKKKSYIKTTVESGKDSSISKLIINYMFFLYWILFINAIWALSLGEISLLYPTLFYLFNFIVVITFYLYFTIFGKRLFEIIIISIIVTLFFQLIISFILPGNGPRATLGFNNPNQLGYFGLLSLAFLLLFNRKKHKWLIMISVALSMWLILLSVSKAALISSIFMLIAYTTFSKTNLKVKTTVIFLLLTISSLFLLKPEFINNIELFNKALDRITEKQSDESLINDRGYGRVYEMGVNIFWGMGEGEYQRFSYLSGNEVHSTFVGILVNYGVVGLVIFAYLLWKGFFLGRIKYFNYTLIISGIPIYWMTHQGVRNTLFWILFVVYHLYILTMEKENKEIASQSNDKLIT